MDNESTARRCACGFTLHPTIFKSEIEYLKSIDQTTRTIKRIAIFWLVLSIVGMFVGFLAVIGAFR
jgi:hypothetical protein